MPRAQLVLVPPLLVALGACGFGAVEVDPHQPAPGTDQVCSALLDRLPEVVSDAVRRPVEPAQAAVAVWGQPPVILRCGVPDPVGLDPSLAVLEVEGVGWYSVAGAGGTFFTTAGREVNVEVAVPDDYAPEATVLADLAPAIRASVPLALGPPSAADAEVSAARADAAARS